MAKKRDVRIVIEVPSNHTMVVPKGTEEMVAELFTAAGLSGDYTLFLGEFIKGTSHNQGVSVRGLVDGRVVKIRVQPGNNTTSQMLKMMVPDSEEPAKFCERLQQAEQKMAVESKSKRMQKKMRRLFRAVRGKDFLINEVPQEIIDELDYDSPDALDKALQQLARNNFILSSGSASRSYKWLPSFRETMEQIGYDPSVEPERESIVPKEEDSEEDKVLSRLLEIGEEIEQCSMRITEINVLAGVLDGQLRPAEAELSSLLKQVEEQNMKVEALRKEESRLAKRAAEAKAEMEALIKEQNDSNERLNMIDKEIKLSDTKRKAEAVLAGLPAEDRARVLSELLSLSQNTN